MNIKNVITLLRLASITIMLAAAGCGVKGDPLPPGTPPEIGIGRPIYKIPREAKPTSIVPNPNDEDEENKNEE